ncbi:hypothetical protein EDS67_10930 [candidate division KSB1 bacterium]|nr:MAG: hypothetical protein EDS67_10930 [candidate division KSB1 bacterium]MBC6949819.1 hypothetical protein [candidate division KSB1 bacterium]MCE7941991.1 hypothetical protein [Chlorobi bacterium CHB1]
MSNLILQSNRALPLRPLVEAALQNELRLLQAGLKRTQQRLLEFETRYGMPTHEFLRRYENNLLEENLELAEWIGEHRLFERLNEKVVTLQEVKLAD